jgi:hypothetical protein
MFPEKVNAASDEEKNIKTPISTTETPANAPTNGPFVTKPAKNPATIGPRIANCFKSSNAITPIMRARIKAIVIINNGLYKNIVRL